MSAAKSEHDALAAALEHGGGSAIASLSAEAGYERALAAALGEDADAAVGEGDGPRRWTGSQAQASDPSLPPGTERLAEHVRAPSELLRRLKQIAVVDEDEGQVLSVGQRLVTRDGVMRRWDGFVAKGAGAAAAERLLRANRLSQLADELPSLQHAVEAASSERDQALQSMDQCRTAAEQARHAALAAERDAREAARAIDAAAAALDRIEAQRSGFAQRQADLDPVLEAAREAVTAAEQALGALPDPAVLEQDIEKARSNAADAAAAVAEKRAEAATRARESAADRERLNAAAEQAEWRASARENAEERLGQRLERQKQQTNERLELEKEPAELDSKIREIEQANDESQVRIGEAAASEREAEQAVIDVAQAVAAANEHSASTRERRAAAAARAEAQQARSAEFARSSVEKFECVPQRLAEKLGFDPNERRNADEEAASLERLTAERERIGPVNLVAEQELAELDASRNKGAEEAEELTQAIHRLRGSIGNLNREGRVRLLDAYQKVDTHFRRLFTTLFEGGQAHLELVESNRRKCVSTFWYAWGRRTPPSRLRLDLSREDSLGASSPLPRPCSVRRRLRRASCSATTSNTLHVRRSAAQAMQLPRRRCAGLGSNPSFSAAERIRTSRRLTGRTRRCAPAAPQPRAAAARRSRVLAECSFAAATACATSITACSASRSSMQRPHRSGPRLSSFACSISRSQIELRGLLL